MPNVQREKSRPGNSMLYSKVSSLPLTNLGLELWRLPLRLEQTLPLSGGPAQARSCPVPFLHRVWDWGLPLSPREGTCCLLHCLVV